MTWWDRKPDEPRRSPRQARKPSEQRRSVYEDPERVGPISWLRRLLGREDHSGSEIITNRNGEPQVVVAKGRPIGYRCVDGSVWKPPEQPVEQWLESGWGDDNEDGEWIVMPVRWRR
jgi:hypothetical protein